MKKREKYLFYFLIPFIATSFQTNDFCNQTKLKEEIVKEYLSPYNYDLSKLTKITYKNKPQVKELELDLFLTEKYKLIFNTKDTPLPVTINLYNKSKERKNRKLLYSSKNEDPNKKIFAFEYSFARKIYIDFEIPADTVSRGTQLTGCIMFLLGYK